MTTKLELVWAGKDNPIQPEPRILLERPELSNTAQDLPSPNMLIHGDNLMALKALERDFAGKVIVKNIIKQNIAMCITMYPLG